MRRWLTTALLAIVTIACGGTGTLPSTPSTSVAPAPTVTAISPFAGVTSGGTIVGITGTGFLSGAAATFGGVGASSVSFDSSTHLLATTPAHAVGNVDVVVTNPDGQRGVLAGGYAYRPEAIALSGNWIGTTSQQERPISFQVTSQGTVTRLSAGWSAAACGLSGTITSGSSQNSISSTGAFLLFLSLSGNPLDLKVVSILGVFDSTTTVSGTLIVLACQSEPTATWNAVKQQ